MARFIMNGLNELISDMEKLAMLPGSVLDEMLDVGADVVEAKQKEIAPKNTGKAAASIQKGKPYIYKGARSILIAPDQKLHHTYRSRKTGALKNVPNAEVLFVQEFGAPRKKIKAKEWMKTANEKAADPMVKKQDEIYGRWLEETMKK